MAGFRVQGVNAERPVLGIPKMSAFATSTALRFQRCLHVSRTRSHPSLSLRHFAPKTKRPPSKKVIVEPAGPIPRNVAVIGGGLAGLAVTYHLLHSTSRRLRGRGSDPEALNVTVFDPCMPGEGGASAAAAGLLHCFTPRAKKKAWEPNRSLDAAMLLLNVAQKRTITPLFKQPGLLRIALEAKSEEDFQIAARRFPREAEFLTPEQVAERFPNARGSSSALLLKHAVVVNTTEYLKHLWAACYDSGRATWRQEEVPTLTALTQENEGTSSSIAMTRSGAMKFDTVVVCTGAAIRALPELNSFPVTPCRGQNLRLETNNDDAVTSVPLISKKYIIPDYFHGDDDITNKGGKRLHHILAGATFEYPSDDETELDFLREIDRDSDVAESQLKQPLTNLMPNLFKEWRTVGGSVGIRALPPRSSDGSIPIACRLADSRDDLNLWAFSGLGSRGLLHHAYLGRMLAHAIASGNELLIPNDARRFSISSSIGAQSGVAEVEKEVS